MVNVLINPKAVLKPLTFSVSIPADPLLRVLKLPSCPAIKPVLITFTDKLLVRLILSVFSAPESPKFPLLYPERAVMGIVAFAYTPVGKLPTRRAAGMLVKLIAEPVK